MQKRPSISTRMNSRRIKPPGQSNFERLKPGLQKALRIKPKTTATKQQIIAGQKQKQTAMAGAVRPKTTVRP